MKGKVVGKWEYFNKNKCTGYQKARPSLGKIEGEGKEM